MDRPSIRALEAAAWLARLKSDAVSVRDRHACEAWLGESEANRRALGEATTAWEAAGALGRSEVSVGSRRSPMLRRELVFGGLACVAGAGIWSANAPRSYATGVGEIRRVELQDGSIATLDTETRMRVHMTRNARHLHLEQGRIRLDAAKDAGRPWAICTSGLEVLGIGGALQVSARGGAEAVTALEGAFSVRTARERPIPLAVGQQVVQGPGRAAVLADAPARALDTSWRFGQLVFDNEPLAAAAKEINRYNSRAVVVAPDLAGLRISGVYRARDADGFADLVAALLGLKVVRAEHEVRLESWSREEA